MKNLSLNKLFLISISIIVFACVINCDAASRNGLRYGANGGVNCAACTVIVALIEQLSIINNQTIEQSLYNFCNFFPSGLFRFTCQQGVDTFGPVIIDGLYANKTPDIICHTLRFCVTDKGQTECTAFPKPKGVSIKQESLDLEKILISKNRNIDLSIKFCDYPVFNAICKFFKEAFGNRYPSEDIDGDGYSDYETLRGSSWRGKDCNDLSSKVHPGRKPGNDSLEDSNCNGIFGLDSDGIPYEEKFCVNSKPRGILALGDSITAHFHLPEEWLDATKISEEAFKHLAFIIENEIDWPQLSGSTGHFQNVWPVVQGNTSSLYLKLWERNKCNFRDYQNVGVNGADTNEMNNSIIATFSRDQKLDQPLIVLYSLVGNDVCNGNPDTFNHMTPPDVFYANVVASMKYLDTRLPAGSHVLLTGLANGSLLYDLLYDHVYPLGRLRNDILYGDFYTYLSCLQLSPCNGWMTVNATVRAQTTEYALMLSGLVKKVAENFKFNNFDMAYIDLPTTQMFDKWVAMGGQPWEIIEPVDGFHINQFGHALYGDIMWEIIQDQHPDWLGDVNPMNANITAVFGNQGGY